MLAVCYPMRAICGRESVTSHQRADPAEPGHRVPLGGLLKGLPSLVLHVAGFVWLETLPRNFSPSQRAVLLATGRPPGPSQTSSRFSPPHGYPASSAATSSLLRDHLPPHTTSAAAWVSSCGSLTRISRFAFGGA